MGRRGNESPVEEPSMKWVVIVLIILIVLVAVLLIANYNGLVGLRNKIESAYSQIDVQLNRRYSLIPNLVETVKGYAAHESGTLEKVVQARNLAMNTNGIADKAEAENAITGALKSVFALSEAYPELKANTNFQQLQAELSSTEDRIAYARQYYNDNVRAYNTKIEAFPSNLIANAFKFTQREYFQAQGDARGDVSVSF
ncbi:MAG: LemA family protein [Microthrixaceae bacterium]|nr:LemA family protein [Microthrixaceae bacterium]